VRDPCAKAVSACSDPINSMRLGEGGRRALALLGGRQLAHIGFECRGAGDLFIYAAANACLACRWEGFEHARACCHKCSMKIYSCQTSERSVAPHNLLVRVEGLSTD
jgi:hypothetical protein